MLLLGLPASASNAQTADAGLLDAIGQDRAIVLKMHGAYGNEVTALGVRRVLDYAKRQNVRHAVLWLDSAGGLDVSGRAIAGQMAELDGDFEFHVVIDRAEGPAVFTVAAADTLWTLPGGHAGTVLSYNAELPQAAPTLPGLPVQPPPDVVQLASDLGAVAAAKGRPGDLFRAMVDPSLELWMWTEDADRRAFGLDQPIGRSGVRDLQQVDTDQTVVALGDDELHDLGLARAASRGDVQHLLANQPFEVDRMLEAASRTVAGLVGRRDSAIERSRGPIEKIDGLWARAAAARQAAEGAEPNPLLIRIDYRTNKMTDESARAWRAAVDQCTGHWKAYQSILKSIGDAEKDHVRLTRAANTQAARFHADLLWPAPDELTPGDIADEAELDVLWREAEAEIRRLRVERGRVR